MILGGIRFPNAWQGSGATNIFGNGWWYHKLGRLIGLNFDHSVFVAKTVTVPANEGNMPLKEDGTTPKEWIPKCIEVRRGTGAALNAVGLSNFGLPFYLKQGKWQSRTEPFSISLASTASEPEQVLAEAKQAVMLLKKEKFLADYVIQWNDSCPNATHADDTNLIFRILSVLQELERPTMVKVGPDCSAARATSITSHEACAALCALNTIKWDDLTDEEKMRYFGTLTSPVEKRLGKGKKGGVSGKPLLPRLIDWIKKARAAGVTKPILGGGGILNFENATHVFEAGADAVYLASMSMLAPSEVKRL